MEKAVMTFVRSLASIITDEINGFTTEISSNREFHNQIEKNRGNRSRGRFQSWYPSISMELGTVVYVLCRILKPEVIVETGVAGGISSAYILAALEQNKYGKLYSIDLPWGNAVGIEKNIQSGWLIPDYLKDKWQLILGSSFDKLQPLLEKLGKMDVFLHDSDHAYKNMFWEYQIAWQYLKANGLLISHNIDYNRAFLDFCKLMNVRGYSYRDFGGAVKN